MIYAQTPKLVNGRHYIILADQEGSDAHLHGIVVAPIGISHEDACEGIEEQVGIAKRDNPEEWNWDDVIQALEKIGFDHIQADVWVE